VSAAIVVDNVSKKFLIGNARYSSLRDIITGSVRGIFGGRAKSDTERTREFWALKDVNFEVEKGATLGIIGPNGAGKSTLLKLLSRVSMPTKGTITTHGRVSALIEVGAGFHPELTGRENVYLNGSILGMTKKEIDKNFDAIVDFSGIEQFIDTPVKYYSSGMYARLGFSVAAHVNPDILLVDEVLSVGDYLFQQKCLERMMAVARSGTTVMFVSHNLPAMAQFCPRALLLFKGDCVAEGPVSDMAALYRKTSEREEKSGSKEGVFGASLVRLDDAAGNETRLFKSGQFFSLTLEASFGQDLDHAAIDIAVFSERGEGLFYTDTDRSGVPLTNIRSGEPMRLRMQGTLGLLGGSYSFSAIGRLVQDGRETIHPIHLCSFEVDNSLYADGVVDLKTVLTRLNG
jgi:lipopolysaccharide transport system ATP-binding protein